MRSLEDPQLKELAHWAVLSDREGVRSDLAICAIKDENDYTSNFASALRRNINLEVRGLIFPLHIDALQIQSMISDWTVESEDRIPGAPPAQ